MYLMLRDCELNPGENLEEYKNHFLDFLGRVHTCNSIIMYSAIYLM